jgi:hypothetical protein
MAGNPLTLSWSITSPQKWIVSKPLPALEPELKKQKTRTTQDQTMGNEKTNCCIFLSSIFLSQFFTRLSVT